MLLILKDKSLSVFNNFYFPSVDLFSNYSQSIGFEHITSLTKFIFYIKLVSVLFLFLFNIYLILFEETSNKVNNNILEAGIINKYKDVLAIASGILVGYKTLLELRTLDANQTINEAKKFKTEQALSENLLNLEKTRKELEALREGKKNAAIELDKYNQRIADAKDKLVETKEINERSTELMKRIQEVAISFNINKSSSDSSNPTTPSLPETNRLETELDSTKLAVSRIEVDIDKLGVDLDSINKELPPVKEETEKNEDYIEDSDIKRSNIIDMEWFEGLDIIKKLALTILIFNSVIISSIISIIFIYYGDYLLTKYNLEKTFPSLARVIQLRKKFSKYYFILSCSLIAISLLFEVSMSLIILSY